MSVATQQDRDEAGRVVALAESNLAKVDALLRDLRADFEQRIARLNEMREEAVELHRRARAALVDMGGVR